MVTAKDWLLPLLGGGCSYQRLLCVLFWTIGVGAVPTVLNAELAHLVRAEGYSGQASFGVAFGGVLNMVLDPIFIFLFQMDIVGAAVATMLSNVAATVYFFGFLYQIRQGSVITPSPKCFSLKRDVSLEVLAVGLPSFIMTLMSTLSNLTLNKTISGYSNEAVAGMGIAKKIDLTAFAIAQGMTQDTLPMIGYNYSSGDRSRREGAAGGLPGAGLQRGCGHPGRGLGYAAGGRTGADRLRRPSASLPEKADAESAGSRIKKQPHWKNASGGVVLLVAAVGLEPTRFPAAF